jgi:hypothetical protein
VKASLRALRFSPAAWAAICVLLASCFLAGGASAGRAADNDASFDNLDIIDSTLNGKLAILRVGSEVGTNNLLSVFAGLKNKTSRRLALEVETIYKDKDGNPLNYGSWIPLTLKAHEESEYHSASISEQAVDFLVRVRRAPNTASSAH